MMGRSTTPGIRVRLLTPKQTAKASYNGRSI